MEQLLDVVRLTWPIILMLLASTVILIATRDKKKK
jgi:hypothetical protein